MQEWRPERELQQREETDSSRPSATHQSCVLRSGEAKEQCIQERSVLVGHFGRAAIRQQMQWLKQEMILDQAFMNPYLKREARPRDSSTDRVHNLPRTE